MIDLGVPEERLSGETQISTRTISDITKISPVSNTYLVTITPRKLLVADILIWVLDSLLNRPFMALVLPMLVP